MAYQINKSNGTLLVSLADGTTDTSTTLTLVGKNYAGYGEYVNENFVKLLECGASASYPGGALAGQLHYHTSDNVLRVYTGSTWKNLGAATSSGTAPTSGLIAGDLWFDSTNTQLKVHDGSSWVLVGPAFTSGTGTSGAIVDTITDTGATSHVVVKLYVEDSVVAIVSKDSSFTPGSSVAKGWGTQVVAPGVTLSTNVSGAVFTGKATNADLLDGMNSTDFVAVAGDSMTGALTILNDSGVTLGADSDLQLSVSGSNTYLTNSTLDGDIIFRVNDGGSTTTPLTIDGATSRLLVSGDPSAALGVATKQYVDNAISITGDLLYKDGTNDISGNIKPATNNTYTFGTNTYRFSTIYATEFNGTATSAEYADLAERFEADDEYEAGTVVELGGVAEITKAIDDLSENVFGVISDRAAYLMNASAGSNATHPPVAMNGRVPVKVIGRVNKGDRLVSAGNGFARAAQDGEATARNIIGRALNTKATDGEGTVEAVVKINF